MLQRAPENRASLDDIIRDPWLQPGGAPSADPHGNAIPLDEQLPLVAREHLSEEDHNNILKKMVAGKIGSQEEIIEYVYVNGRVTRAVLIFI